MSLPFARGWRGPVLVVCAAVTLLSPASSPVAQVASQAPAPVTPNFELASRWTSAKVGKLVFDTSVTPHWLQSGDRFWYSYQTRRRVVDVLAHQKNIAGLKSWCQFRPQTSVMTALQNAIGPW